MDKSLSNIINKIIRFRDERDWKQFHNPKDLALSICIEASELLECFQWKSIEDVKKLINIDNFRNEMSDEIADIAIYLLILCNELNIDLLDAVEAKIQKNSEKYPIDKSKGNAKKYTDL